jgi:hypothetical protein
MDDPFGGDLLRALLAQVQAILAARDHHSISLARLEQKLLLMLASGEKSDLAPGRALLEAPGVALARSLLLTRNPDDSASVEIDGGKAFHLPPRLADVLECLASPGAESAGSLVPWKSRDSVREWLEVKACKKLDGQYVNKLICKLRWRLERAGLDRRLIQSHPSKGVRFALKRCPPNGPQVIVRDLW